MTPDLERETAELYGEHAAALLRYASSLARDDEAARDGVQETFLRYCLERRYGRSIANPRAWLFQVLRNHLIAGFKSAAARRETAAEDLDSMPVGTIDPEAIARRRQRAGEIRSRLTGRELECLQLRAEGLSYAEIAGRLDIRSGTVGALLTRVHEKLRWPPGREGTIGVGTAEAVHFLFAGGAPCATWTSSR